MTKSDNKKVVGQHVFECAGLGVAPFRLVRYEYKVYRATPDAPAQPGATCDYCGTGIKECCVIQDSAGVEFIVGTHCVNKTGDVGIIQAYKKSPEYREFKNKQRHAREAIRIQEGVQFAQAHRSELEAFPHPLDFRAEQGDTLADYFDWSMANAGNSGQLHAIKVIKMRINP